MNKKITIITPSYNQGRYLEQTIDSVLSQNYSNLDYIIIDGGSTDNSVDIIKKYEKHLSFWVSEKDSGQSEAINKGINKASGEIINWLCSDDYLENGSLEIINEAFKEENINVVSGRFRQFQDDGSFEKIYPGTEITDLLEKTIVTKYLQQPSTFFRTNFFKNLMINETLQWYMCYEIWVKYLIKDGQNNFKKIDDLLVHYRLHEDSKTENNSQTSLDPSNNYMMDRNTIFYHMANQLNLKKEKKIIRELSEKIVEEYHIGFDLKKYSNLIKKIIAQYLYYIGKKIYYEVDIDKSKNILKAINLNHINNENQKNEINYLIKKSKFEPINKKLRSIPFLAEIKRKI